MKIISTEKYNEIINCMNNANRVLKELKIKNDKLNAELDEVKNNLIVNRDSLSMNDEKIKSIIKNALNKNRRLPDGNQMVDIRKRNTYEAGAFFGAKLFIDNYS